MRRSILAAGISALALGASGAFAQDSGAVLEGAAAFGSWEDDAPGVTRNLTPDDLEAPFLSESVGNGPETIDRPAGAMPVVPEGFTVELVAEGLFNPRHMLVAPNGDLFVADTQGDRVLVFRFGEDGSATPVEQTSYAVDLTQPYGMAFYPTGDSPEWLYVANTDSVVRFPYAGELEATAAPEVVVDNLPTGGHSTRGIVFLPDNETMLVSVGSESNVADGLEALPEGFIEANPLGAIWGYESRRADVLAFSPDGSNERIYATGLRNCAGMGMQWETGEPWCAVNERDALGDNIPYDYATSVAEGAFYGWPWYYIGGNEEPRLAGARPDLADQVTVPDVLFQAHSAALNVVFYDHDEFGADYAGDGFVALHGSWNRGARTGYKVVRLLVENGEPTGEYQDFMTGFVIDAANVWGRPVGVAVGKDGSLYVSEDGNGTIWKVTRTAE